MDRDYSQKSTFEFVHDEALGTSETVSSSSSEASVDRAGLGEVFPQVRSVKFLDRTPPTSCDESEISSIDHAEVNDDGPRHLESQPPQVSLQDFLFSIIRKTPGHSERKGFFSETELAALLTEEIIAKELQLCSRGVRLRTAQKLATQIRGQFSAPSLPKTYTKIFAILVLCDKAEAISQFLRHDVSDSDLPLVKFAPWDSSPLPNLFHLARKGCQKKLKCFQNWSYTAISRFEEWQWTTIAPFFSLGGRKSVKHLELQDQAVLPFEKDSRFPDRASVSSRLEFKGGFSQVFRVSIHPDHHSLNAPDTENEFAVKCLFSRDYADFKREFDALVRFTGDSHKHLVSLLATYEQFGEFHMIFPWARSDLQDYWTSHPSPALDHEAVCWLADQCAGLARGLAQIHRHKTTLAEHRTNSMKLESRAGPGSTDDREKEQLRQLLFGRHGDIKPENILWYTDKSKQNDRGILKISDFGLTEFSARHSQVYKRNSQLAHSVSYRAPECDLEGGFVGQSYDIWTLGCLYLELIAWQLGGVQLLEDFRRRRMTFDPMRLRGTDTFFEIVHCEQTNTLGSMVKPAVKAFILDLHAHKACTEFFHEFINLIEGEMLRIKSPNPNEKDRASIEHVCATLKKLGERCAGIDYALKPAPWSRRSGDRRQSEEAVEVDVAKLPEEILRWGHLRTHQGTTLPRDRPAMSTKVNI